MNKAKWSWILMHIFAVVAMTSFLFYELVAKIVGQFIVTIGVLGMAICALIFVKNLSYLWDKP